MQNELTQFCVEGPCPDDTPTNYDRIAASPESLAEFVRQWQSRDPSVLWCKGAHGCANMLDDLDFECTDDMYTGCIVDWLNSPAEGSAE